MTDGVGEIHSAGLIVISDEAVHCIQRYGKKKKFEFAKTRLLDHEDAPEAAVRALRKEGGINLRVDQIEFVSSTEYRFGQAWKTVSWFVHRCSGSLPIGRYENGTTSSAFEPWDAVVKGSSLSRKLRDFVWMASDMRG